MSCSYDDGVVMMIPNNRASQLWTKTVSSSTFKLLFSGICHTSNRDEYTHMLRDCELTSRVYQFAQLNISSRWLIHNHCPNLHQHILDKKWSTILMPGVVWKFFMNNHMKRFRAHILTLDCLHFQNGISCRSPGILLCLIFPIYKNWAYTLKK